MLKDNPGVSALKIVFQQTTNPLATLQNQSERADSHLVNQVPA